MQRSKVKEEDKWDLSKYFKNEEEYQKQYDSVLKKVEKLVQMQGHVYDSSESLFSFLELSDKLSEELEQLYVYSYLYHYSDQNDDYGLKLRDRADKLVETVEEKTSFERSELLSVSYDKVQELIKENKKLEKYAFYLEKVFRYKDHTLSESEEKIIALASNASGTPDSAFSALDNADAKFDSVLLDGKEMELNHSTFIKYMNNKDRDFRKRVFETYYKFFIEHRNIICELYKGQVKEDLFMSKVRKYTSPLEMSLYGDDISVDVYKNLINTIHDNFKPFYDYMKLRKDILGYDELHMYDLYVDLSKDEPREFTFEEAKEIVLDSLKVLGDDYIKNLSLAFDNRWIDKYPNDGKRSGAYQWGSYGVSPNVSLNFNGTEDSVSTMAHELGHAMHSYYSDGNQEHIYAQYPIFLAEIASTVNEVIVNDYLIRNAKNDDERLLYVTEFLNKYKATVYRQTMFAEFEMLIHDKEQNGEALTPAALEETYYNLNKLYFGDNVCVDDLIKYEWSRIPHFYSPFYVYKYATGFSAAIAIASDILSGKKGAKEKYIEFLKSGGSKYPLDTLKACGVDMTKKEALEKGIKMFEEKLLLAKELMKKVK